MSVYIAYDRIGIIALPDKVFDVIYSTGGKIEIKLEFYHFFSTVDIESDGHSLQFTAVFNVAARHRADKRRKRKRSYRYFLN